MERLWSPWRLAYVTGASGGDPACVFCDALSPTAQNTRGGDPGQVKDLILIRGRLCYAILNLYPYNGGHLMVVLNRHVGTLAATTPDEQAELMRLTRHAEIALTEAYTPHGINIGVNIGRPAGAGVLDHLHVHLVPRWNGDTNFMTVVGNTRVLPEDLAQSAARLRPIFERLARADA
jgi:ATP adenylyltransferase